MQHKTTILPWGRPQTSRHCPGATQEWKASKRATIFVLGDTSILQARVSRTRRFLLTFFLAQFLWRATLLRMASSTRSPSGFSCNPCLPIGSAADSCGVYAPHPCHASFPSLQTDCLPIHCASGDSPAPPRGGTNYCGVEVWIVDLDWNA